MGHILWKKKSSGFPSDVLQLLCLPAAFYLVELSPTTTHCCSCSFGLQAAFMLLSGTSMNRRVKAEQSSDIRGKTREDIFSMKYDPVLLKMLFRATYYCASLSFVFRSHRSQSSLHNIALILS